MQHWAHPLAVRRRRTTNNENANPKGDEVEFAKLDMTQILPASQEGVKEFP
jgi:hypothetical protein